MLFLICYSALRFALMWLVGELLISRGRLCSSCQLKWLYLGEKARLWDYKNVASHRARLKARCQVLNLVIPMNNFMYQIIWTFRSSFHGTTHRDCFCGDTTDLCRRFVAGLAGVITWVCRLFFIYTIMWKKLFCIWSAFLLVLHNLLPEWIKLSCTKTFLVRIILCTET